MRSHGAHEPLIEGQCAHVRLASPEELVHPAAARAHGSVERRRPRGADALQRKPAEDSVQSHELVQDWIAGPVVRIEQGSQIMDLIESRLTVDGTKRKGAEARIQRATHVLGGGIAPMFELVAMKEHHAWT